MVHAHAHACAYSRVLYTTLARLAKTHQSLFTCPHKAAAVTGNGHKANEPPSRPQGHGHLPLHVEQLQRPSTLSNLKQLHHGKEARRVHA